MLQSERATLPERPVRMSQSLNPVKPENPPEFRVSFKSGRRTIKVLEAIGADLRISSTTAPAMDEQVTVTGTIGSGNELTCSGRVHWIDLRSSPFEVGIVLDKTIPVEMEVRQSGCTRTGIRFPCRIAGRILWRGERPGSMQAMAMNYCRDGCCLQVRCTIPMGTELLFAWKTGSTEHAIVGLVRWSIGQNGGFLIGLELEDSMGYELATLQQ